MQRNDDPVAEFAEHSNGVELDDLRFAALRKVFRKEAAAIAVRVARVVDRRADRLEAHLEYVARVGAFDVDRPRENVSARPRLDLGPRGIDVFRELLDAIRVEARTNERG